MRMQAVDGVVVARASRGRRKRSVLRCARARDKESRQGKQGVASRASSMAGSSNCGPCEASRNSEAQQKVAEGAQMERTARGLEWERRMGKGRKRRWARLGVWVWMAGVEKRERGRTRGGRERARKSVREGWRGEGECVEGAWRRGGGGPASGGRVARGPPCWRCARCAR